MSLKELCSFSQTCKRFQNLCQNHFHRKCLNNEVNKTMIIGYDDGIFFVSQIENYTVNFNNFIKELWIKENVLPIEWILDRNKHLDVSHIANFIEKKCDPNLHKITIVGVVKLVPFCDEIKNILSQVEVVEFLNRRFSGQEEAQFLKQCSNVRKLILDEIIQMENVDAILQQRYHQLEEFQACAKVSTLNPDKLEIFFQLNDQIRRVKLYFAIYDHHEDIAVDHASDVVRALDLAKNLEHLNLAIGSSVTKRFDDFCKFMKVLGNRVKFNSLELQFISEMGANVLNSHANQLAQLKQLTKIHLSYMELINVTAALRVMANLKIIEIYYLVDVDEWNENVTLPQVEEVRIQSVDQNSSSYIVQLARYWANLKRVLVRTRVINSFFPISYLNLARQKLRNATELTIFADFEKNGTNPDQKLVKLKNVKFDSEGNIILV